MDSGGTTFDTDSEDELPVGWEERVSLEGNVYYANHILEITQWDHPVSKRQKIIVGELPYGWEQKVNEDGNIYYIDQLSNKTTYTDPRLAYAVSDEVKIGQRYDGRTTADQILLGRNLSGKYIVVTGANSGIGFDTVKSLSCHGAHVVLACRNLRLARKCIDEVKQIQPRAVLHAMYCDLASLESVHAFADQYKSKKWPLHVLILNAGVFYHPYTRTIDNFDLTIQVNYLSHFYLLGLFVELLIRSAPARIVIVSSESHRFGHLDKSFLNANLFSPDEKSYSRIDAYNFSKLCLVLMSKEVSKRFVNENVSCNVVHPGNVINTNISRHWWFWRFLFKILQPFSKSKLQGASTSVYCAIARELEGVSGRYFNNCFQISPSEMALDEQLVIALWNLTCSTLNKCCKSKIMNDKYL